jgi:hypothetical protein
VPTPVKHGGNHIVKSSIATKIKVVLKALPTWLTGIAVAVTAVSSEISDKFPQAAKGVAAVAVPVLAALAAAISIIRRVTPVLDSQVGLTLPTGAPAIVPVNEAK